MDKNTIIKIINYIEAEIQQLDAENDMNADSKELAYRRILNFLFKEIN